MSNARRSVSAILKDFEEACQDGANLLEGYIMVPFLEWQRDFAKRDRSGSVLFPAVVAFSVLLDHMVEMMVSDSGIEDVETSEFVRIILSLIHDLNGTKPRQRRA